MRVYIEYGWPEGKWHARLLASSLRKSGFEIAETPEEAEIVIAHSGGCYMLPENIEPKLVLHIGLPNWPGRLVAVSTLMKWRLETINGYWMKKLFFQGIYFINIVTTYSTWKAWRVKQLYNYPSSTIILIRNELDTYMHPEISQRLADKRNWEYMELSGGHDDIWEEPQAYVDLLGEFLMPLKY